jgi:hypothetical protein
MPVTPSSSDEAKEDEEKSADTSTVLLAVPTPADIANLCNQPLSLGPSPATAARAKSLEARSRKFLLHRVTVERVRLGLTPDQPEPPYQTTKDILRRLTDLWEYSARIIQFNRYFDDLLSARDYEVDLPLPTPTSSDLAAIALTPLASSPVTPLAPPEYPDAETYLSAYTPLVPSAPLPPLTSLISPHMFSVEPPPLSDEELSRFTATTQFTRFADEPRFAADFLPTLTGLTRGLPGRDTQPHAYRY